MSAERQPLLTYPFLGVPTAVSSSWDGLYWIGERYQAGLDVRDGRPEVRPCDASRPHLVHARANADLVVEFDQVQAVPSAALDVDGCATRAFALLTDNATVGRVAVAPHEFIPWPHVAKRGMTIALCRSLNKLFYLSTEYDLQDDPDLFAVPVLDNNMVDWSQAGFADEFPEFRQLDLDTVSVIQRSLVNAERRRTDTGSPNLLKFFHGVGGRHVVTPIWAPTPQEEERAAIAGTFASDVGYPALQALGELYIAGYAGDLTGEALEAATQAGDLITVISWYQDAGPEGREELATMVREITPETADRINCGTVFTQLAHLMTALGHKGFRMQFGLDVTKN